MNDKIIKAENINKSYMVKNQTKTHVLKGIDIQIFRGEFLAVTGPSGAGKSTLLHLLGSLDEPDEGKIEFLSDGKTFNFAMMDSNRLAEFRNRNIGFIFQFHHLLPEFNALENVMIPALISGLSFKKARDRAMELLIKVDINDKAEQKPSELSGGEQQRIAIARSLINNPQIVFADEPTGSLDMKNAESVLNLIQQLRLEFNLTFVVATHSPEVARMAQRVVHIKDGKTENI